MNFYLKNFYENTCWVFSITIGVNVQAYTTSNILMNIHIISSGIDVIKLVTVILIVQFFLIKIKQFMKLMNKLN